jgi:hypothetical protein
MKRRLGSLSFEGVALDPRLEAIAKHGFVHEDGAWFLGDLRVVNAHVTRADFPGLVGFEAFINSLHVEDYAEGDSLAQAVLFIERVLVRWRETATAGTLVGLVTDNGETTVVKFHCARPGEPWLAEDLEGYADESVMVTDSLSQREAERTRPPMKPATAYATLHAGDMLVASVAASQTGRRAWVAIYPLDSDRESTRDLLRNHEQPMPLPAIRTYRIRRFELENTLAQEDIGESELRGKIDLFAYGDGDLVVKLSGLGVKLEDLVPPFRSDYPL